MNCNAGDFAIVIGANEYSGRLVRVLYIAPTDVEHILPDGHKNMASPANCWVIKSIGSPFLAPIFRGNKFIGTRETIYGVGSDSGLRPLRATLEEIKESEVLGLGA